MATIGEAEAMAERLRAALGETGAAPDPAACLDLVARQFGFADWAAASRGLDPAGAEAPRLSPAIPILRIFDQAKAREFYLGFLGFEPEFEHRFGPGMPLYMGVRRSDLRLHLSEHHGDATPGSTGFVPMRGIRAFHAELAARDYAFNRPGIDSAPWGDVLEVVDPFGNRLRFCERRDD